MFTCVICPVNWQTAFTMSHFTWIQHFLIGFSIEARYIFFSMLYDMFSPKIPRIFMEALSPAPVACNLPCLAHMSFERLFNPMDRHAIREIEYFKLTIEICDEEKMRRNKVGILGKCRCKDRPFGTKLTSILSSTYSWSVVGP
ncbi:hypothetical protein L6452_07817 [Arctium lappa]|uniref:Uncharacterized protein n=1 Tax=Arctium lappa TaxID=4217 RepID=A0ACB9EM60_ARCLA|nr:hypothetical protein L6452_07817 [Arctium lappa]